MLGWNLYLLMHFSTGSKISSEAWFILYGFSFIFKFETVSLKKVFSWIEWDIWFYQSLVLAQVGEK